MDKQLSVDELLSAYLHLQRADQLDLVTLIQHHSRIRNTNHDANDGDGHHTDGTSSASTATPPATDKAGGRKDGSKKDKTGRRYYTVVRATPDTSSLLGIHYCLWDHLRKKLPSRTLGEWGGMLKGFDRLSEAVDFWHEDHTIEPVIHNDG